ncbi:hypothetical protein MKX01_013372 [Papaver californicum]|nr:hypothetical protein MKX01_013372 [Papaver californicum]
MATEINPEDISSSTIDPLSVPSSAEEINNNSAVVDDKKIEANEPRFTRTLYNTVDPYHRHLFLVYKNAEYWASFPGRPEKDSLPRYLGVALYSHAHKTSIKTRMTLCEAHHGTDSSDGDVFVFPDMVKYRGLTNNDADKFVEDVLVNGKGWVSGPEELKVHVFVSSHGSREDEMKMNDQVFVAPCSRVSGLSMSPENLIIFSPDPSTGVITGHWHAYAIPRDVPDLLDQHIGKGDIFSIMFFAKVIYRGRMLAVGEKPLKSVGTAFTSGTVLEKGEKEEYQASTKAGDMVKDARSCCQGPNGVSGRRDVERVENTTNVKKPRVNIFSQN